MMFNAVTSEGFCDFDIYETKRVSILQSGATSFKLAHAALLFCVFEIGGYQTITPPLANDSRASCGPRI